LQQNEERAAHEEEEGMTEKPVWYEYLGNIDGELLLQNLTNINPHINSIDEIRSLFAELKTRGESLAVSAGFSESKRLVQLVIEPGEWFEEIPRSIS
jgi:hypothetical protein